MKKRVDSALGLLFMGTVFTAIGLGFIWGLPYAFVGFGLGLCAIGFTMGLLSDLDDLP